MDGDQRKAHLGKMLIKDNHMKIAFIGDYPKEAEERETEVEELKRLFQIAEQVTDTDLQKIGRICQRADTQGEAVKE